MIPMSRRLLPLVLASLAACASAPAPAAQEPAPAQAPAPAADTGEQFQLANASGELIPEEQVLVPGKITVVDFYADWCAPCKVLEKQLRTEIDGETRIAVRKIDVGKGEADVIIARYGVKNLPHVRIYGPDGKLLHDLPGNQAEQTGRLALDALTSL
jgi:thiol:disulfide interchange protein